MAEPEWLALDGDGGFQPGAPWLRRLEEIGRARKSGDLGLEESGDLAREPDEVAQLEADLGLEESDDTPRGLHEVAQLEAYLGHDDIVTPRHVRARRQADPKEDDLQRGDHLRPHAS